MIMILPYYPKHSQRDFRKVMNYPVDPHKINEGRELCRHCLQHSPAGDQIEFAFKSFYFEFDLIFDKALHTSRQASPLFTFLVHLVTRMCTGLLMPR